MKRLPLKRLLIISLCLHGITLVAFVGKRIYFSQGPSDKHPQTEWADRYNVMRSDVQGSLAVDSGDIVFVGNSLTEGFPVSEMFPGLPVKNRGISSNRTSHVLGRIRRIAEAKPAKIFIEIGTNDIQAGVFIDSIIKNYQGIIRYIKSTSPNTGIYALSVFPVSMQYGWANDSIKTFNTTLQGLCAYEDATYIDIHSALVKNNILDSSYTADGIHLNMKGYRIWREKVARLLDSSVKSP
jgi:lysophospholipase L1-like esterase